MKLKLILISLPFVESDPRLRCRVVHNLSRGRVIVGLSFLPARLLPRHRSVCPRLFCQSLDRRAIDVTFYGIKALAGEIQKLDNNKHVNQPDWSKLDMVYLIVWLLFLLSLCDRV